MLYMKYILELVGSLLLVGSAAMLVSDVYRMMQFGQKFLVPKEARAGLRIPVARRKDCSARRGCVVAVDFRAGDCGGTEWDGGSTGKSDGWDVAGDAVFGGALCDAARRSGGVVQYAGSALYDWFDRG